MNSNFLQSKDWFDFQRSLGRPVFEYDKEGVKAGVIKFSLPFGKSYLYIPYGPNINFDSMTGGIKNPIINFISWLKELAKKENAIFIKAEPLADSVAQILAENKFKKSRKEIQPSKTVVIDLTKNEDELLNAMRHKTRYNIKVAEKNSIVVKKSEDFESFWKLLKKTTERDKFSSHSKDYYQKLLEFFKNSSAELGINRDIKTELYLAYYENNPVAGLILLTYKDATYYLHGALDYDYRGFMAPYKLHWEIIRKLHPPAGRAGVASCNLYDLWGIDSKRWPGVTRFKLGWGGRVVEYPSSFDLSISQLWFWAYKMARRP